MPKLLYRSILAMFVGFSVYASIGSACATAVPIFENGKLAGAKGVLVGSLGTFNVNFTNDSCANAFPGRCDPAQFAFHTQADADLASKAIHEQVLIGEFDNYPEFTLNCVGALSCVIRTPFGTEYGRYGSYTAVLASDLINNAALIYFSSDASYPYMPDQINASNATDVNYAFNYPFVQINLNYAVWQRQAVSVPEPSGLWCMVVGLIGFGILRRRSFLRNSR